MRYLAASFTLIAATVLAFPDLQFTRHPVAGNIGPFTRTSRQQFSAGNIPVVLTNNGLSTLVNWLVKAGLADALSGSGPFTVFAPSNHAFASLDPSTLNTILNDVNLLRKVLGYHIAISTGPSVNVENESTPKTLTGDKLRVNIYSTDIGETVTVNGALKVRTLQADNGVIHVINKVLIPEPDSNIVKVLQKKGEFTTFLSGLTAAGLTSTIESAGPFTLFAPNDAAFRALPAGTLDSLIANPEELKKVLLTHVAPGTLYSRGFSSGPIPVLAGGKVDAVAARGGFRVGNAQVITSDLFASNGVVHVVNAVNLPPTAVRSPKALAIPQKPVAKHIISVLKENGLTTLVELMSRGGLADGLSLTGPFTLFAPTNDAFEAIDKASFNSLLQNINLLQNVLMYHVVAAALPPTSISNELVTRTLNGEQLRINIYGTGPKAVVTVNGVLRLKTLDASNGIIYVIDKILIPGNEKSIIKVLEAKGKFKTLLTALAVAGLTRHVDTAGPFTFFAPTDEAFRSLPPGTLGSLLANPQDLRLTLLSHMVFGTTYKRGFSSGHFNLARGGNVPFFVSQNGVKISNADVIEADVPATNGVIHVINRVI